MDRDANGWSVKGRWRKSVGGKGRRWAMRQTRMSALRGWLHQFDFVAFGRVDKGEATTVFFHVRAVGILDAMSGQMFSELLKIFDFESKVSEIGLDGHGAAVGEVTDLDEFFTLGRLEKDQLGAARRFMTADFMQTEDVPVKADGLFQIVHSIAGVKKFFDSAHELKITRGPTAVDDFVVAGASGGSVPLEMRGFEFILAPMLRGFWVFVVVLIATQVLSRAQLDPEKRRLLQVGYNLPLEGRGPIAGYGFFYYNQPEFFSTNRSLRLAIAPIYLDSEFGFKGLLGEHTDLGLGLAGGGFADSYFEIRRGKFLDEESFTGHGGEFSTSAYHLFNPGQEIPLWGVLRGSVHQSFYSKDSDTDDAFELPDDRMVLSLRTGVRLGGEEPSLTEPLALELSVWHESRFRLESGRYGFNNDRLVEPATHQFWARALVKYMFGPSEQFLDLGLTAGMSVDTDRFSTYRLGGILPFVTEFPLAIPGYYYQEISAKHFALLNAEYSFPLEPSKSWRLNTFAATGPVQYLEGQDQPGKWHNGVGAGITYISPSGSWFVTVAYGYGFDAIRNHGRGANQLGLLFQYDFEAKRSGKARWFIPGTDPYRSRAGERIFR